MNGLGLLLIGCGVACYTLLRVVFRDGPGFHDRLADFDEHVNTLPIPIVDEREDAAEFAARWHEIVARYGPRGSIA